MISPAESKEPEVKILSLSISCPGRPDLVLPYPFISNSKSSSLFTLKEGSRYHLKLCFIVSNNLVSGLKYTNTVWKTGVRGELNNHTMPYHTIPWHFSNQSQWVLPACSGSYEGDARHLQPTKRAIHIRAGRRKHPIRHFCQGLLLCQNQGD